MMISKRVTRIGAQVDPGCTVPPPGEINDCSTNQHMQLVGPSATPGLGLGNRIPRDEFVIAPRRKRWKFLDPNSIYTDRGIGPWVDKQFGPDVHEISNTDYSRVI